MWERLSKLPKACNPNISEDFRVSGRQLLDISSKVTPLNNFCAPKSFLLFDSSVSYSIQQQLFDIQNTLQLSWGWTENVPLSRVV